MCYDISFTVNISELADYFPGLQFDEQVDINFGRLDHVQGVGVFSEHPVVYINRESFKPHCKMMEWSCIEYSTKEEPGWKTRNGMLNIRSERVLGDTNSYWYKIRNRRCLMPVTGIYEHREVKGWKNKVPYLVKPLHQQRVFFLPGLYSVAELPDKETGELLKRHTFALMTRAANAVMRNIHNSGDNRHRMPLFLPFEMCKAFLSENLTLADYKDILNYEMKSEDLYFHPVHTIRTSKLRGDGKSKHEPWNWDKLPDLGKEGPE